MPSAFLDTNVLVYAAIGKGPEERKKRIAQDLLKTTDFGVSTQIMAEFYATIVRKAEPPLPEMDIDLWLTSLSQRTCLPIDVALVRRGVSISRRYKFSYWDGAIIAAAERMGAETLYTEDLNDGQAYGAVTACNPFAESRDAS